MKSFKTFHNKTLMQKSVNKHKTQGNMEGILKGFLICFHVIQQYAIKYQNSNKNYLLSIGRKYKRELRGTLPVHFPTKSLNLFRHLSKHRLSCLTQLDRNHVPAHLATTRQLFSHHFLQKTYYFLERHLFHISVPTISEK